MQFDFLKTKQGTLSMPHLMSHLTLDQYNYDREEVYDATPIEQFSSL